MILLFTPKINNRVHYIVKTLLKDICGFEYNITNSAEDFLNYRGCRINYSDRDLPGTSLKIFPSGFLLQKGVKDFQPNFIMQDDVPLLFPNTRDDVRCDLGYDIFSSAFYQLSRYEEYLPFLEDRHGRFEADQSFAYQHGFLEKPVVDINAMNLAEKLTTLFPFIKKREKQFTFIPTYDIDVAYAYKAKGFARTILLFLKDILLLNRKNLLYRIAVINGSKPDPFDTYDLQLQLQRKYKLNPVYFFLCSRLGPKDRNISIHSPAFTSLVKTIGDYAETGIHPSYASNHRPARLAEEISILSGILNMPIEKSRQHFLKFELPHTYQQLIKHGIKKEFSMGFASHTGFRAGTCSSFYFYDLSMETETKLQIFPTQVMDGTLRDYMKLKPAEALKKIQQIMDEVKRVEGTFISLWHNDTLNNKDEWAGWYHVYIQMLEYATNKQGNASVVE